MLPRVDVRLAVAVNLELILERVPRAAHNVAREHIRNLLARAIVTLVEGYNIDFLAIVEQNQLFLEIFRDFPRLQRLALILDRVFSAIGHSRVRLDYHLISFFSFLLRRSR